MKLNELLSKKGNSQKKISNSNQTKFFNSRTFIENSSQGSLISLFPKDSIRDLLGFNATTFYGKYNPSQNPRDILSIDNIFLETDIAQGKGKSFTLSKVKDLE